MRRRREAYVQPQGDEPAEGEGRSIMGWSDSGSSKPEAGWSKVA
jgi:hypothetical protein